MTYRPTTVALAVLLSIGALPILACATPLDDPFGPLGFDASPSTVGSPAPSPSSALFEHAAKTTNPERRKAAQRTIR